MFFDVYRLSSTNHQKYCLKTNFIVSVLLVRSISFIHDCVINPILHGLFLHPILYGGGYFHAPLCNFLRRACRTKAIIWRCWSDSKFFSNIIWGDDVISPVDDVTFLVKKTIFFLFRGLLLF